MALRICPVDGLRPPSRFGLGNQGLDRFHWASVRSVGYFARLIPFSTPKTRGEVHFSHRLLETGGNGYQGGKRRQAVPVHSKPVSNDSIS